MTEPYRPPLLIVADSPEALTDLCGISLLERMRRIALQLDFREAMILSNSMRAVTSHVANRDVRTGAIPKRERQICTAPRLVSDMRSHRLHGVGQNHRLAKTELQRDATHSFQQRDPAEVRQCLRGICDD